MCAAKSQSVFVLLPKSATLNVCEQQRCSETEGLDSDEL